MKKYIVKQNGYIMIHGSPCELKIGQSVSKLVYDNYPNFVDEVEIGFNKLPEIKEPIVEQKSEPIILNEEPIDPVVPEFIVKANEYVAEHIDEITAEELEDLGNENIAERVLETIENDSEDDSEIGSTPVEEVVQKKGKGRPKADK